MRKTEGSNNDWGFVLNTHVFEGDASLVDGVPGGPLATGEHVAHAGFVRLVLAHAAREAVAGDTCDRERYDLNFCFITKPRPNP